MSGDDERSEALERLGEDVDEAMSPVVDELWAPILGPVLRELDRDAAANPGPSPESIIERMRANGLYDPEG
ncbi:hypothetical protein [Actinomycetospora flava]|uniref:Addiction module component n=1 Tax=Actinomycetospora flava TaxID=3129232 RepID=A0ABU8MFU1_9PSEU